MKKIVICLALATVAVSCKKIQAGGNKNIIKLEEGTERYSDDHQGGSEAHGTAHETTTTAHAEPAKDAKGTEAPKTDSTAAKKVEPAKAGH
ncbi:hypothetical protein [Chryseobacterium turcicum]|uniref:Uncharacterized protein n=1 Tax=Chryseobacterium turcicum TaxID=2898076 RepID=A0A9Q3V2P5_9FLAO|nr:hypothetical protein [Chryseobacterium turcicum]MCD1117032.1 hypothetical protein [Chryseobacterium turcicum]